MTRHSIALVFVCIVSAIGAIASELPIVQSNNDLSIWVQYVRMHSDHLEIAFLIENLTNKTIWICQTNNFKQPEFPFESIILKEERRLRLNIKSFIIPEHIHLYQPLCAQYQKIPRRGTLVFPIIIEFPIGNSSPIDVRWKTLLENKLKAEGIDYAMLQTTPELKERIYKEIAQDESLLFFEELHGIDIEFGYYKKWLFFPSAICPAKGTEHNTILINSDWAKENAESTISLSINKDFLEAFLKK